LRTMLGQAPCVVTAHSGNIPKHNSEHACDNFRRHSVLGFRTNHCGITLAERERPMGWFADHLDQPKLGLNGAERTGELGIADDPGNARGKLA